LDRRIPVEQSGFSTGNETDGWSEATVNIQRAK